MKAILFDRFGEPADVLHVGEKPTPEPRAGEVRVRMLLSPVNPSDLMTVRGRYGKRPALPAVPGYEGVGVVDAAGPGLLARLRGLKPGRRVAVLNSAGGNWQELVTIPARQAVPLPKTLPDEQAAMFFVNPATALVLTRYVLRVPPGAWLLQTAAGSALGRMVIRLAQRERWKTINVVRRRETAKEVRELGGDAVICTAEEDVAERVKDITSGGGVRYALDAVGGAMGSAAVAALAPGGRLIVYGTLSQEPLTVDPRQLLIRQAIVQGFWLSTWTAEQTPLGMLRLFRQLGRLIEDGTLASPVEKVCAMADICDAVRQAETPGPSGKILLRFGAT